MGDTLKDLLKNPFLYPWKFLLSTSSTYEAEIKTSRSNLQLSFELWRQLADLTTETLDLPTQSSEPTATQDGFIKAVVPGSARPAGKLVGTTQSAPTPSARKTPSAPVMSNRARTEKGLLEALIEARRAGAAGASFQRRPGTYSTILKGTQKDPGEKPGTG